MNKVKSAGFSVVELLILLVLLGGITFAGYKVYKDRHPAAQPVANSSVVPAKIQSKADIDKATKTLDSQNINTNLDPTQLDSSISSLY